MGKLRAEAMYMNLLSYYESCYCWYSFSIDTFQWKENILEDRILQLTAWRTYAPPTRQEKLRRINRALKH